VLALARLGRGREEYHLQAVGADASEHDAERGEVAGRWLGGGARDLGLQGRVQDRALLAVLAGYEPGARRQEDGSWLGTRLVAPAPSGRRTPGFDACFTVPKSVSLLWAFGDRVRVGDRRLDRVVEQAHAEAVSEAVAYLERAAARGRRGTNGLRQVGSSGLVAAVFRQRTSRANDPHLHSHVLVANLCRGEDGRWGALDARLLFVQAKTTGHLYAAHLRHRLSVELGVGWGEVVHGIADVVGVPEALIARFSKRSWEIRGRVAEVTERINRERERLGLEPIAVGSPEALEIAARQTRAAKLHHLATSELRASWREEAAAVGFDPEQLARVLHRVRGASPLRPDPDLHRRVTARLTEHASTFGERDVVQALAAEARSGLPVSEVLRQAHALLASKEVVSVVGGPRDQDVIRRTDGRVVAVPTRERRWSTPELLDLEARLVEGALRRRREGVAVVPETILEAVLRGGRGRQPAPDADQVELTIRLARSGAGVECVEATPRAGAAALRPYVAACWRAGIPVVGCAPSVRGRDELRRGVGIEPYHTPDQLLPELGQGAPSAGGMVVILVEAATIGSRGLLRLLEAAATSRAKVVLVGSRGRCSAVDAGGGFRGLAACLGAYHVRGGERWEGGEGHAEMVVASSLGRRAVGRSWPRAAALGLPPGPAGEGRYVPSPGSSSVPARGGRLGQDRQGMGGRDGRRGRRMRGRRTPVIDGQGGLPGAMRASPTTVSVAGGAALRTSLRRPMG